MTDLFFRQYAEICGIDHRFISIIVIESITFPNFKK